MPRKVRELLKAYRKAGAAIDTASGKGSHRKITHSDYSGMVIVSGKDGEDAKPYQEKDLKKFLEDIK
ncbi:type II toxin-antitoxin system HicA family toxin [Rubellicoccus peritrichatus]|uniref:Type II toxin-antitoxin system HicA family toxin n=1 Tax=Rubellicoccus peritrichatus TaxID=3080537 RepID=A0AAQ3QWZ9_9BACT|nr:type II toxin-antitoxin system HicA family toxin [Puniceicoccus sp. CR14]WOO43173.1 type II toxin-antitoxin system HicA family toxin [Puniceicoccus sp. CR14]